MSQSKSILFSALITVLLLSSTAVAPSQVGIGINLGPAPICPYGYYGPDWFVGGVFLGAGPWFHGPHGFYGHVDNRYDPHHGYIGPMPDRGAHPFTHFQGNEARDGQGHVGSAGHDAGGEHAAGYAGMRGGGGRRR